MAALIPIGLFKSSEEFFQAGLAKVWTIDDIDNRDLNHPSTLKYKGFHKLLDIILASEPLVLRDQSESSDSEDEDEDDEQDSEPEEEYFVPRHDDLDHQNILVDGRGNVTGIIDWDGCMAVPRCVGYTGLPTFLRRDWLRSYDMSMRPFHTWSFKRYRNIYSAAMAKACSNGVTDVKYTEAKFTAKSAMYQAVLAALYEDDGCIELIENLLAEIEVFRRVDVNEFCIRLGRGLSAAEAVLKEKIGDLFGTDY